jgi:hypothetical protein
MYIPGFLIPSDLGRMIPAGADPLLWAESSLLASPGALVMKDGQTFRIPTLVPATKEDGSCIHYRQRSCQIWENSPFGCAFFGCGAVDEDRLSHEGLAAILRAWRGPEPPLYVMLWTHLWDAGRRARGPQENRDRMAG